MVDWQHPVLRHLQIEVERLEFDMEDFEIGNNMDVGPIGADLNVRAELKSLRKRLYTYHNELLEIERQSKLCRDACEEARQKNQDINQPSTSKSRSRSRRIFNEDETEIDALSASFTPLKNEYILEMIANYLPSQDIKSCRLVCRLWGKEMYRCLSKRKLLIVTDEDCCEAKDILNQYKQQCLVSISNLCFFDVSTESDIHKNLIAAFGWTLSGLKLEECKVTPQALARILSRQAPNLESFSFKDRATINRQVNSTFSLIQQSLQEVNPEDLEAEVTQFGLPELKRLHWDEEFGRVQLNEIISTCPNLIELVLKNIPVPAPETFRRLRWNSLTALKFSPRDELREEYCLALASLKLRLKRLTLYGVNPKVKVRMEKLKKFLLSVAPTLVELELFQHYSISSVVYKPDFESPFPVKLPVLKRLYLDFSLFRSWKTTNSLPQLRSLDCKAKTSSDWHEVLKHGIPKEHKTLTHLNFGSIDNEVLKKISCCFRALTNLELDAVKMDDDAFRSIIKGFPQLQQLKLSKIPMCPKLDVTDSGITGIPEEVCQKLRLKGIFGNGSTIVRKFPNILDLKNLYRLELCANSSKLTDIAILFGIANLSKLLILGLPRCDITDASLNAIGERLPGLTMVDIPRCPNITEKGISALKSKRSGMIIQCGLDRWNLANIQA